MEVLETDAVFPLLRENICSKPLLLCNIWLLMLYKYILLTHVCVYINTYIHTHIDL